MNKLAFPVSAKKYGLIIMCSLACIAVIYWGMGIYLEPIDGDLTRVGNLSEKSFGWNRQQPNIPAELLKNHPISEADIVVFGDSFSDTLVWQTKLASTGYKTYTLSQTAANSAFSYDFLKDKALCNSVGDDNGVADSLRKAGFKGKYVVIESVERSFQLRINNSCSESNAAAKLSYKDGFTSAPQPPPVNRWRYPSLKSSLNSSLGWMLKVLKNEVRLRSSRSTEGLMTFNDVRVAALDGCGFFSNQLCNYGLFISGDFNKKTFDLTDKILSISRNLQRSGIRIIWLVVPDKSTIYLGYGKYNRYPYVNIWNELARHPELAAPNLGELFTEQARIIKDFYAPNNTHLSTNGYLYLGELMLKQIKSLESR